MKTLTLSAIALTLLTSVAYARDNDARDSWKWLQSVSHDQTAVAKSNAVSDSGGGSSSSSQVQVEQHSYDKGGRSH
jgi:hypothetical protein